MPETQVKNPRPPPGAHTAKPAAQVAAAQAAQAANPLQTMKREEFKPYATLKELATNWKGVETAVSRNTLKAAWWLGYHVEQVLSNKGYGDCGMQTLVDTLFAETPEDERKHKGKLLYLYARFHTGYEWKHVEDRLIKHRVPLRVIERLLTIKDAKIRTEVEDLVIGGMPVDHALIEAGVKKALPPPAAAEPEEGSEDAPGGEEQAAKKTNTPAAGKVLQALASAEAQGGLFRGALSKLEKSLKGYATCTDGKDRKVVSEELSKVLDDLLLDLPGQLTEVIDAAKRNQD